jgi:hypothetical protein
MPEEEKRFRELEDALAELREAVKLAGIMPGLPRGAQSARAVASIELAERMLDRIKASELLPEEQAAKLHELGKVALQERLRDVARGAAVSETINITVTGTCTISTD